MKGTQIVLYKVSLTLKSVNVTLERNELLEAIKKKSIDVSSRTGQAHIISTNFRHV